jgi:hypothetical protein
MGFWETTWTNILGGIGAGLVLLFAYMLVQWFLAATDLVIAYNWGYKAENGQFLAWPNLDIRNRSRSKSYRLANIAYTVGGKPHWFDNKSIMGVVIEPGSMNFDFKPLPVPRIDSIAEMLALEVTIRLQTGRAFWLRGQGPGQMGKSKIRRLFFWLRAQLEKVMIPME